MHKLFIVLSTFFPAATCWAITLPAPPSIGTASSSSDIWEYAKQALVAIGGLAGVLLLVFVVYSISGGLVAGLKEAREKERWGQLVTYMLAGMIVTLFVGWAVYQAGQYLNLL